MNEDVLKPFPCKESDCNMSFFTEDHLSVHLEAKHRKLNLEIPKGSSIIFADQTPTPTRLLNNCEELRVFDDLQNINPFEEGFRRAVEDNGSEQSYSGLTYQDTLHTPQILPQIELKKEDDKQQPEQNDYERLKDSISKASKLKEVASLSHQIPLLPKPILCAAPILTLTAATQKAEPDHDKSSVKDRLKNIILSTNNDRKRRLETVPAIVIGAPLMATTSLTSSVSERLQIANNGSTDDTDNSRIAKEVSRKRPKVEKGEFTSLKVERNRAAARRYRTKMKIQSQALQEKYDKSQKELTVVRKELSELKKELNHVKALLLVHRDCPVSKVAILPSQL